MLEVFPYPPNWRQMLTERLEWLTDVVIARDGTESRQALRYAPRRTLEYQAMMRGTDLQGFDALMWENGGGRFVLPIWTDPQILRTALPAESFAVFCDVDGYDFVTGRYAVLWASPSEYEAVEILAVVPGDPEVPSPSYVSFKTPTTRSWPAGTRVYPGHPARLPAELTISRPVSVLAESTLSWEIIDNPGILSLQPEPEDLYQDMEVRMQRTDWSTATDVKYARLQERVESPLGRIFVDNISPPHTARTMHLKMLHRESIIEYRRWLHTRRGRDAAYWQPQWDEALTLSRPVTANATTLWVSGVGSSRYLGRDERRDIAILNIRTGQWLFRRVTNILEDEGGEDRLTIDSSLGVTIQPGHNLITWLVPSRLDTDAVEIAWYTPRSATSVFDSRSLP